MRSPKRSSIVVKLEPIDDLYGCLWGINDADVSSVFCIRCFSSVCSMKILDIFVCTWIY